MKRPASARMGAGVVLDSSGKIEAPAARAAFLGALRDRRLDP